MDTANSFLFFVGPPPSTAVAPFAVLHPSDWDDYGYRTSFRLDIAAADGSTTSIGDTKVLSRTLARDPMSFLSSRVSLPASFSALDPNEFASLGQSSDFYLNLHRLSVKMPDLPAPLTTLRALNDIASGSEQATGWWRTHDALNASLLRTASANIAMRDSRALVRGARPDTHCRNIIPFNKMNSNDFDVAGHFEFDGSLAVPGRINVVVGRNGAGKTHLLRALANWIAGATYSHWESYKPPFSAVVYSSQNTFDNHSLERELGSGGSIRFVGQKPLDFKTLQRIALSGEPDAGGGAWAQAIVELFPKPADLLKLIVQSDGAIASNLVRLKGNAEWDDFLRGALGAVGSDPKQMSAGQRALVEIYSGLELELESGSLLLLDEPENFLHPSLIASFIKHLGRLLDRKSSFAVLATHSPVVIQETPSKFVWIANRLEGEAAKTTLQQPPFETFGEGISEITEFLFETDSRSSQWKSTLREFVQQGMDTAQIEAQLSGRKLPLLARAYVERQRIKGAAPK